MSIEVENLMNLADGQVLYDDLRDRQEDMIKVSDTQPVTDSTKIWIKDSATSSIQVPTYDELNEKASAIIKTESGSIVSFSDGADEMPLKNCVVSLEPVQDLHGYDNPWPAGGGKNKLLVNATTQTINGITFTVNADGTVIANGTATANAFLTLANADFLRDSPTGTYVLNGCPSGGSGSTYNVDVQGATGADTGSGVSIVYGSSDFNTSVRIRIYNGATVSNLLFKPMIRLATESDATFAPYSNICPITGWTGATVVDDPIYGGFINWNQYIDLDFTNTSKYSKANVTPVVTDRKVTLTSTSDSTTLKGLYLKKNLAENHVFVFCGKIKNGTAANVNIGIFTYSNGSAKNVTNEGTTAVDVCEIYTNTNGTNWFGIRLQNSSERGTYGEFEDIQLFDLTEMFGAGNEPATVEEFKSLFPNGYYEFNAGEKTCVSAASNLPHKEVNISWETEAGTVYGGSLNLTTGVLTVNHATIDLGTLGWAKYGAENEIFYAKITGMDDSNASALCSSYYVMPGWINLGQLPDKAAQTHPNLNNIYIRDDSYSDYTSFKAAVSGVQLVYELATPQIYQLTSTELTTLLGQNNIWADTGNVTVQYCADTKSYVDGAIPDVPVTDVQIKGTSILQNGVANIPTGQNALGVVQQAGMGVGVNANGYLTLTLANASQIKGGTHYYSAIEPSNQHQATFYGLAKAAGADMASSSNAVGVYTDDAKQSIQTMLGTNTVLAPAEQDISNASRAYSVGEMLSAKGKLYKVTSNIAIGDVIIPGNTSGCNCIETTVSESFPHDVQVNGTSILSNGVADVLIASVNNLGVVKKAGTGYSIDINANGEMAVVGADSAGIKNPSSNSKRPILPVRQHESVFYGLAKAAGDTTQSASSNAVGIYTDDAQSAIQTMLNVPSKTDTVLDTTLSCGRKANTTVGTASFAFGTDVEASGTYSHAEGGGTTASGNCAHAEGGGTTSSGTYSHAEGGGTTASGVCSHAEGGGTLASGSNSHADGTYTIAGHKSQHVFGEYNIADAPTESISVRGTYVEIVGNGSETNGRSNARTLDWNGNESLAGSLTLGAGTANQVTVTATQLSYLLNITDATGVNF